MIYRETLCMYYSSGNGKCFRYNFGIRMSDFNEKTKTKIKNSLKKNIIPDELLEYQKEITEIVDYTNKEISSFKLKNGRKPTIEELRQMLDYRTSIIQEEEKKTNFLEYLNEYLNHKEKKFIKNKTISSLKDYKSFRNSILDFQLLLNKNLEILDFNLTLLEKYFDFIFGDREYNEHYITRGKLDGKTIKKRFDTLKTFYNWCLLYKKLEVQDILNDIIIFKKDNDFTKITKDVKRVSLTIQQVQLIKNYPYESLSSPEKKSREMFLVVLYTGMRISDLTTLRKEHIFFDKERIFIKRKSVKTKKIYEVEIDKFIYQIIEKNNFNMKLLSDQKSNLYIKVFLSKIPEFQIETIYENNSVNPPKKYKYYELITFHTGRRTFITNLIDNRGLSITDIKSITDHTQITTIEKYVSWKGGDKKSILDLYDDKS